MSIHRYRNVIASLATGAFILAGLLPAVASAQAGVLHLELVGPITSMMTTNCSTWHELYPGHCSTHHQDDYQDNGDGVLSACDGIKLSGVDYHIDWVGPTYRLVPCGTTDDPSFYEPRDPLPGDDPTCEMWEEIWPNHGQLAHVDQWVDNGDGVLSECDQVFIAGVCYHIEYIGLNIEVSPGTVGDEQHSWGKVKSDY